MRSLAIMVLFTSQRFDHDSGQRTKYRNGQEVSHQDHANLSGGPVELKRDYADNSQHRQKIAEDANHLSEPQAPDLGIAKNVARR